MNIFLFRYIRLGLCLLLIIAMQVHAQERHPGIPVNREVLQDMSDSLEYSYQDAYLRGLEKARSLGLRSDYTTLEGVNYSLQRIENGLPYYFRTLNRGGAATSGANKLHPGGSLRLYVTGKGLTAGVWDAGMVYNIHPEFSDRVDIVDFGDNFNSHATHVAGTMIAAGIQDNARGMAYQARVKSFNWNNDLAQMASEASKGMLVSNHSYGISLGWSWQDGEWKWMGQPSADQDYRFGFYSETSRALDLIAYNAPYYLIVWAAGNDRTDLGNGSKPRDGPYDTIGPEGAAKNVLTVGAVNGINAGYARPTDVTRTSFSSWGPTDDGRVKPDIVTKGTQVYSTDLNSGYSTKQGTSMASPMAAGSLLLIQDLFHTLSGGSYLRASSLKGLAIHTANQAGYSPGPDYEYGWGLLDVSKMADFLLYADTENILFAEDTLRANQTYRYEFVSDGKEPILATLSWTDPHATPVAAQLNPTDLMLVNDLDMRIIHEDSKEHLPWILNPEIPMLMPTTGDNFRDNVEKILVEKPAPGKYTLIISHKNTLKNNYQAFSLFLQNGNLPKRNTLYWIGQNGSWHDPNNWSLQSGGQPADIIPGSDDHVLLDAASFAADDQEITLADDAACFSLTVEAQAKGFINLGGNILHVASSLYADREVFRSGMANTVVFDGGLKNGIIFVKGQKSSDGDSLNLVFDNPDGAWYITEDIRANSIHLKRGAVSLGAEVMRLTSLVVEDDITARLDLGKTELVLTGELILPNTAERVVGTQAHVVFVPDSLQTETTARLAAGNARLNKLTSMQTIEITGSLDLVSFENNARLDLTGELRVDQLTFSENAAFYLHDDTYIYVGDVFSGAGTEDKPVVFSGTGNGSGIVGNRNLIFCLDYLSISHVPVTGQGAFNAGPNSLVENSPGWFNIVCEDMILADYRVISPCVNSWTFFEERSQGGVQQWEWHFGELGSSSLQNPVMQFTATGDYPVSLRVEKDMLAHTTSSYVTIRDNPLPEPTLHISARTYFVDIDNVRYQWYRNGIAIADATARTFENTDNVNGVFTVLISDGQCNRPARNEIVVGIPEHTAPNNPLKIFPNPVKAITNIVAQQRMDEVSLYDMSGRRVYLSKPGSDTCQLDVSGLVPGIYIVRVISQEAVFQEKIQIIE